MANPNRRIFLEALALGAGTLAASQAGAAPLDGHAAGYDVAPSSEFLKTIPRKTGDAVTFTASLDKGPIKATSGGWAREITMRGLPIATDIAGAHLFMNAGGSREMHWHNSAEWAYIVDGHCQVTVVDPEGLARGRQSRPRRSLVLSQGAQPRDPDARHVPCHAILAFDDGLYSEHGTFGISDWMSRYDPQTLTQAFGVSAEVLGQDPESRDLHHARGCAAARRPAGALRARTGSRPNPSLRPDGAEAAGQVRRAARSMSPRRRNFRCRRR